MNAELKKLINQRGEKSEALRKDGFCKDWNISRRRLNSLWSGQTPLSKYEMLAFLAFEDATEVDHFFKTRAEGRLSDQIATVEPFAYEM